MFALADAGVLLDLHSSPTFLMLPGKDVLHGTLFTGKGTGEDHIEHKSGGSALMNKQRMTGTNSKHYARLHLAQEDRTCSPEPTPGDDKKRAPEKERCEFLSSSAAPRV